MTSKSFRAILPPLSDAEVHRLRAWSAENCAAAAFFREHGCLVWLASKERARSREAFMRSVRALLKRLAIDVARLRGRWLMLTDDDVVQAEVARRAAAQPPSPAPVVPSPCHRGDSDNERVILLTGGHRQSHVRPVQVLKEE